MTVGSVGAPGVTATTPERVAASTARPAVADVRPQGRESTPGLTKDARAEFSSFVLSSFLEAAVPKSLGGPEQQGAGGDMWRSMLVQQLAKTLARSGQIDLLGSGAAPVAARQPEAHRPSTGGTNNVAAGTWQATVERR